MASALPKSNEKPHQCHECIIKKESVHHTPVEMTAKQVTECRVSSKREVTVIQGDNPLDHEINLTECDPGCVDNRTSRITFPEELKQLYGTEIIATWETIMNSAIRFDLEWEFVVGDLVTLRKSKPKYDVRPEDYLGTGYEKWRMPCCSDIKWEFLPPMELLDFEFLSNHFGSLSDKQDSVSHPRPCVSELQYRISQTVRLSREYVQPVQGGPHSLEPVVVRDCSRRSSKRCSRKIYYDRQHSQELPSPIVGGSHSLEAFPQPQFFAGVPLAFQTAVPPDRQYELGDNNRGPALIFESVKYELERDRREHSDIDSRKLTLLWKDMGFKVHHFLDRSRQQILDILDRWTKSDHSDTSCFVCCFLAHGGMGHINTVDGGELKVYDDIVVRFSAGNCPGLSGKPKLFFFQSCQSFPLLHRSCPEFETHNLPRSESTENHVMRPTSAYESTQSLPAIGHMQVAEVLPACVSGSETCNKSMILYPLQCDGNDCHCVTLSYVDGKDAPLKECYDSDMLEIIEGAQKFLETERDFLVSWATMPGEVAMREQRIGSQYINMLDQLLRAGQKHVANIMDDVAVEVRCLTDKRSTKLPRGQLPVKHCSFQKYLYLTPVKH